MSDIAQRLRHVTESVTSGATAKAKAMRDAGEHVINLAAGELDVDSPPSAVSAAIDAARDGRMHHYGPPSGLVELRNAVAEHLSRPDAPLTADNVLITTGTKQALFHAILSTIDPGDEVLLPAPYWTSYPTMIQLAGAVPVEILAGHDRDFKVDVEMLDRAATERTKMLVFVSPGNPTGAVYTPAETRAIGEWAANRGVLVLSDEIYEGLAYEPHEARAISDLVPDLRGTCLRAGGVGKTFAMTGWRVGWLVGPTATLRAASALQSHSTAHPANVAQAGALAVLDHGETDWLDSIRAKLKRRRTFAVDALSAIPGVECPMPAGAFYAFPSLHAYLGTSIAGRVITSTIDLADVLLTETGTVVVPGEAFGAPGYIRLSYAIDESDLVDGIGRIAELLSTASQPSQSTPVAQ